MVKQQSKRARREAARRAKQRQKQMMRGGIGAAVIVVIAAFVFLNSGSDSSAGALAPDFALTSAEGETVALSDYSGQPVVLTFMHTY